MERLCGILPALSRHKEDNDAALIKVDSKMRGGGLRRI